VQRNVRSILTFLSAFIGLLIVSPVRAETVNGLTLQIELEPTGRTEFHPGEVLKISAVVKNDRAMSLPADSISLHVELHVTMPDGNENVWDPVQWAYAIEKWREIMLVREWHRAGAESRPAGRWELRLADGMRNWIDPGGNDLLHVSARQPGAYRLW